MTPAATAGDEPIDQMQHPAVRVNQRVGVPNHHIMEHPSDRDVTYPAVCAHE
jgi:hypothetical protein